MFRFFTLPGRIQKKLSGLKDLMLLILKEIDKNRPFLLEKMIDSESNHNGEVAIKEEEVPKVELAVTRYVDTKSAVDSLDTSKSIFYRDIHTRLLTPISFKGRRVYFIQNQVDALAKLKKTSGLDYKDLDSEKNE